MFDCLRVFEVREPVEESLYQIPAVDVPSDGGGGGGTVTQVSKPPVIIDISTEGLRWRTVPGSESYIVEELSSGTLWNQAHTLPAPVSTRILWTGFEWQIQILSGTVWTTIYRGLSPKVGEVPQNPPNPTLVPVWYRPDGVTVESGIAVHAGTELDPEGVTVSGATNVNVNAPYNSGSLINNKGAFAGPAIVVDTFSPDAGPFYRIRAVNSAGVSGPSNTVALPPNPPFDCGGQPSDLSEVVWSVNNELSASVSYDFSDPANPVLSASVAAPYTIANAVFDDVSMTICNPTAVDLRIGFDASEITGTNRNKLVIGWESDTLIPAFSVTGVTFSVALDLTATPIVFTGPLRFSLTPA